MKRKTTAFLLFFTWVMVAAAQSPLKLEDAIRKGLEHNYQILLVKKDSLLLSNDATAGNAGMLPSLTLNGSASGSSNNINQKFATGLEVNRTGVGSSATGANIALAWTLFDGFKMFATLDKLQEIEARGEMLVRQQMEETVAQIIAAYFNIARQQQLQRSLEDLIAIYEERVKIAETRLEAGNGSKADVLQAKIDLNEQKSNLLKQQTLVENGVSELNILLGNEAGTTLLVSEEFELKKGVTEGDAVNDMKQKSASFRLLESDIRIAGLQKKEALSLNYPRIGVQAGYAFNRNSSQAGFALLNQSNGLNYGVNFTWNLYGGGMARRGVEDARVMESMAKIRYEKLLKEQQEKLIQAGTSYRAAVALLSLESQTDSLAEENVSIMMERFALGQSTSLELKDAQNSLLNARIRLANARYDAKISETELLKIRGRLLE